MTHKDAVAHLVRDLAEARPLKDFDAIHDHAVRCLEGGFPLHAVHQIIEYDHGVKPQVAALLVAAAAAALECNVQSKT